MSEVPEAHTLSSAAVKHEFYKMPELPYSIDALEPVLSGETLDLHYGKHAKGYFEKTNELVAGSGLEGLPLEDVVKRAKGKLFDQSAQALNHVFYWNCMAPVDSKRMSSVFGRVLEKNFGSQEKFRSMFEKKAKDHFGSGWAWLVKLEDGSLKIETRANAGNPIIDSLQPILTCDLWEHAYYVDYRNERETYLDAFWRLVNWDFVEGSFEAGRGPP
jgi:superoxide dismutase, Fe-Mn family